ncbi:MAG: pyruvate, phosphate dikinase [Firmicutes bacterium]|nr:pyruvate, phosphate dikinase [Bacillota bacterium]
MKTDQHVFLFEEGSANMKEILGGKGANLAEMTRIGLPVPPGFTISTAACMDYYASGQQISSRLKEEVLRALKKIEVKTKKKFGDPSEPLLVSVRSGAVVSMPGMMDTILNLGLNDQTAEGLAKATNNRRFALDCYRRFIQMFADVVLKIDHYNFEEILEKVKEQKGVREDIELDEEALEQVIAAFKNLVAKKAGSPFPQDPEKQLIMAIQSVFDSWNNQRAVVYRKIHKIPDNLGTAVNIQAMVFGNWGEDSGTGVAFTRNPSTGEPVLYGEFLRNAQGEDVVAGIRTPQPIESLKEAFPEVDKQFKKICNLLEGHYRDMQDVEFTIERGRLFILQTRAGKRTAAAAIRIAVDLVKEGVINEEEALLRIKPEQIDQLLHKQIDPSCQLDVIAVGLSASPGAASGEVCFDADLAEKKAKQGKKVILVRPETTPDDIHGIVAAEGLLTSRGGMTSHAAVVARGMGKPCVCGCESLRIDLKAGEFVLENGDKVTEGEVISIDGGTGRVFRGSAPLIAPQLSEEFKTFLSWADKVRRLKVLTNADTPEDARRAREFGAEGIGLCRTEHMFMAQDRLPVVQEMILAGSPSERNQALAKLLPMQYEDFYAILKEMQGLPVTIRLLDPPLHEFLPHLEDLTVEVALLKERGEDPHVISEKEKLLQKVRSLSETNPMLGHRGCRLGLVYPEIYRMQARGIFLAAADLIKEGIEPLVEIMVPLVGHVNELSPLRRVIEEVAAEVSEEKNCKFSYRIGTMIELPRACVTADQIAVDADFFSFGTNDLTQTTFGFSRDDAEGKFLPFYLQQKILTANPFVVLDQEGVGSLIRQAVELGRGRKGSLKVGICGEHGGEASSIAFSNAIGLDYVRCSPFRVPAARLAAAQAAVNNKDQSK